MKPENKIALLCCNSSMNLGKRLFKELLQIFKINKNISNINPKFVNSEEIWFANGEVKTVINDDIKGNDLYILQSLDDPLSRRTINDNLIALFTAIETSFQSGAKNINVIVPQYPYCRQERKKTQEPITAKIMASFFEICQTNRLITVDVHSETIAGFFRKTKFENLYTSKIIIDYFRKTYPKINFTVVSPDIGSISRARIYANEFNSNLVVINKERDYSIPGKIENMQLFGNTENKNILLCDDMISTGSTLIKACELLKKNSAKDIYLVTSFPFLHNSAIDKFKQSYKEGLIKQLIGTDLVFWGNEFISKNKWYTEISIAPLLAKTIYDINNYS